MLAGPPRAEVAVPPAVAARARGWHPRPVWQNQLDGLTFALRRGNQRRFLKWAPRESGLDLETEATKLRWAHSFTPVPEVLDVGRDESGTWLLTTALDGESAVSPRWKAAPRAAAWAVGRALRALHDALPVDDCPFSWSLTDRLARQPAAGRSPETSHAEHRILGGAEIAARLADAPDVDELVVCHGDACVPNTLLLDDGTCGGHVDLAALGVADRWADLAVATWSTDWNYGPGFEGELLEGYGIDRDEARIAFYRLVWDVT